MFLRTIPFHMLSTEEMIQALSHGEWVTTIDLKDAYFHIPIAEHHWRFLRFAFQGKHFQFRVLPFGLSLSPRVFTRVVAAVSPTGTGYQDSSIPRRLAHMCTDPRTGQSGHSDCSRAYRSLGPESESRQEQFGPGAAYHFSGGQPEHDLHESLPLSTACRGHCDNAVRLSEGQGTAFCLVSSAAGHVNSCLRCGTSGAALVAPNADVAKQPTLGSDTVCTQAQEDTRVTPVSRLPVSVEGQGVDYTRRSSGLSTRAERGCLYGCLLHGLGCDLAGQCGPGGVAPTSVLRTHKCSGINCCTSGSAPISRVSARQTCTHSLRQHVCGLPCEPHGGGAFGETSTRDSTAPDMGRTPICQPKSSPCSRGAESGGGLSIPAESVTGGMEASPRGGGAHLGDFWQGDGGPVCVRGGQPLPSLVLSGRQHQSAGPGCAGARLAEGPTLRFSSVPADRPHTPESPSRGAQTPPGGPLLAGEDVVSDAAQTLLRLSYASPLQDGPFVPDGGADITSQSRSPSALGLAATGPRSDFSEFGGEVGHTMRNARAPSTQLLYNNRWKLFERWCRDRGQDPVQCPVASVLSFLQGLLNRGRSPSTLKVYVAAISCRHIEVDGGTVGSNKYISLFLKGARRLHPPRRPVVPPWDLTMVLEALKSPPFEPLAEVGMKWRSMKTAFLLAMVSAKRVGELRALSVHESCCRWNPDRSGVTLWPDASFVPKVASWATSVQPLQLARFEAGDACQHLCPVRALDVYMRSTATMRKTNQLFVCYAGPRKGQALSKQRLAHWVVGTITQAYSTRGQSLPVGVRCHSTRGITTSWAAMTGVPLEVICAAASWTTPNTFARFYRVNVAASHPLEGVLRQDTCSS